MPLPMLNTLIDRTSFKALINLFPAIGEKWLKVTSTSTIQGLLPSISATSGDTSSVNLLQLMLKINKLQVFLSALIGEVKQSLLFEISSSVRVAQLFLKITAILSAMVSIIPQLCILKDFKVVTFCNASIIVTAASFVN